VLDGVLGINGSIAGGTPCLAQVAASSWMLIAEAVAAVVVPLLLCLVPLPGRVGVIARATLKEAVRQPIFPLMMLAAAGWLLLNSVLPMFTFGEDVKVYKDISLATTLIVGLVQAVYTSSTSIANEIEGKTAMTLLSKPVTRRQFVVGKYIGILQSALLLMLPLCVMFLVLIYFKVGYDAKESSLSAPAFAERMQVVTQVVPGLILILFEVSVLSAISVAISTRMPMVVNIVICLTIFVVGHLTPMLVQANVLQLEFVTLTARAIATLLPALEVFNIQAAIATGAAVPASYVLWAGVYSLAYVTAAILLAFILFEDRDLA
jgi:ABC-type transport system involved in multi-copper enzyme maturation permease subunit